MTENRFEEDCNDCHQNQYDYSTLQSRYEANIERNEIIEWNKDADNAQYCNLEIIAEQLNFKQMQLEKCREGYKNLHEEKERWRKSWIEEMEDQEEQSRTILQLIKENEELKQGYNDAKKDVEKYEQILKDIMKDNLLIQDLKG